MHRCLKPLIVCLPLLTTFACKVEVPDVDEQGVFQCRGDDNCIDQYTCARGRCIPREAFVNCGDRECQNFEFCATCPADCGVCTNCNRDGVCGPDESCASCVDDCGGCGTTCNFNGFCDNSEDCDRCPSDCDECGTCNFDSVCNEVETCASCSQDCGFCGTCNNDGVCNVNEGCRDCSGDCGDCNTCNHDGTCNNGEGCAGCPDDCGKCQTCNNNGSCDPGEACAFCSRDCGVCTNCFLNGVCDGDEDCGSCPQDCGSCDACNQDGVCGGNESCGSCQRDCGRCFSCFRDGECGRTESCSSCAEDCCSFDTCGNNSCDTAAGENCSWCPSDCKTCFGCGDGYCDSAGGEGCNNCQGDCGACFGCGDLFCDSSLSESCDWCSTDCGICGVGSCNYNGACDGDESCQSCANDCGICNDCNNDGACSASETCSSCSADCGQCGLCNADSVCDRINGEGCESCSVDCGECQRCNFNGVCDVFETCSGCSTDCSCTLEIVSGGDQTAQLGKPFTSDIVVRVNKGSGGAGEIVFFGGTAGDSPVAFSPSAVLTDSNGEARARVFAGRVAGVHAVTVASPGAAISMTLTMTVSDLTEGTIFTFANARNVGTTFNEEGHASPVTSFNQISGLALDSRNGDLYVSDRWNYRVMRISAGGVTRRIAGGTLQGQGDSGDDGPARAAQFSSPGELLLHEAGNSLLISDESNIRVRRVDLATGEVTHLVNGFGPMALLSDSDVVLLDRSGSSGSGMGQLRRLDWDTKTEVVLPLPSPTDCAQPPTPDKALAVDAYDNIFFGGSDYCIGRPRVYRLTSGSGVLQALDGVINATGVTSADTSGPLSNTYFVDIRGLAFDAGGNLHIAGSLEYQAPTYTDRYRIRTVEPVLQQVRTTAGSGSGSLFGGDYGPATAAQLWTPRALVATASGDLIIADADNSAVRIVRGIAAAPATAPSVTLSLVVGDGQAGRVNEALGTWLTVSAADASGSKFNNLPVRFVPVTSGGGIQTWARVTGETGIEGQIEAKVRLGLRPRDATDPYVFEARATNLHNQHLPGSPVRFTATANDVLPGDIFTSLNVLGANDTSLLDANVLPPASLVPAQRPHGMVADGAGKIYYSDEWACIIASIDADGVVAHVAGNGICGYSGDTGAATEAQLYYPKGLALNEGADMLYVADYQNYRVRRIDLTTGVITTVAGNGNYVQDSAPVFPDATGGGGDPATLQAIPAPISLSLVTGYLGRNGLYIVSESSKYVRRVAPATNLLTRVVALSDAPDESCPYSATGIETLRGGVYRIAPRPNPTDSNLLFASRACNTSSPCSCSDVIGAYDLAVGSAMIFAGTSSASLSEDNKSQYVRLGHIDGITVASNGDVYFTTNDYNVYPQKNAVMRVKRVDNWVVRIAGVPGLTATMTSPIGDYGPGTSAATSLPLGIAVTEDAARGVLVHFADSDIKRIRSVRLSATSQ